MNIFDKLFDLYLDAKFKIEDTIFDIKNKYYDWKDGVKGLESYVDGHGDVFEVEKKPKKKKKASKKKKK